MEAKGHVSIASCSHIGLCRLDLALRTKIQACIYIYTGSALRASLYIGIYTCIWAIYAQSKPCIHIYGCHIYVCCLHLHVNMHYVLCIYHFACCKLVVLHHYSPQRGESPSTPCRKIAYSAMVQG